jgi:hypothetical protein
MPALALSGRPYLNVCWAVVDAGQALSGAERYVVNDVTKGGTDRNISLRSKISDQLEAHITAYDLDGDDLLFTRDMLLTEIRVRRAEQRAAALATPIPQGLGRTEPNEQGRTWRHGTLNAYIRARCRCRRCRHRMSHCSAARENTQPCAAVERPRPSDGHIPRDLFRKQIWLATPWSSRRPGARRSTNCATLTHPGCSRVARTSLWSRNGSATRTSLRPSGTFTPWTRWRKPPSTRLPYFEDGRDDLARRRRQRGA